MAKIAIRVIPQAKKSEIVGFKDDRWVIRLKALPIEGKANEALIEFFSKILDISKSRIHISQGLKDRRKLIEVDGLTLEEIKAELQGI